MHLYVMIYIKQVLRKAQQRAKPAHEQFSPLCFWAMLLLVGPCKILCMCKLFRPHLALFSHKPCAEIALMSLKVKQRTLPKSISCGKTFQGPNKLRKLEEVLKWLKELGRELEERVAVDRAENSREPKLLTVHAGQISRSGALRRPAADVIAEDCLALVSSIHMQDHHLAQAPQVQDLSRSCSTAALDQC